MQPISTYSAIDSEAMKYDIRESIARRIKPDKRTICEVHREVYRKASDEIASTDPELADWLMERMAEAFDMGKRMNAKLVEHRKANK